MYYHLYVNTIDFLKDYITYRNSDYWDEGCREDFPSISPRHCIKVSAVNSKLVIGLFYG